MPRPIQLYCPNCKKITSSKNADYETAKAFTGDYGPGFAFNDHPDIKKWYRRVRVCLACEQEFTTAEIDEHVLQELVYLRIRVEELRKTIEVHKAAAKSASDALDQLSSAVDAIAEVESKKADV